MIRLKTTKGNPKDIDMNWWIVRWTMFPPKYGHQVKELSPSTELYNDFLKVKKEGNFNREWFNNVYVPRFINEIKTNCEAQNLLNELKEKSNKEDINLCYYCEDETLCHRSIVGGILLGMGAKIGCNPEYKKYWELYLEQQT